MVLAFYKPHGILSQFTADGSKWAPLSGFGFPPRVYPVGRLDADSEGLLILTDEAVLNQKLIHPRSNHPREYWVQVEGIPDDGALEELSRGVLVQGKRTLPCKVKRLEPDPVLPPRDPPIRFRKSVPTSWISLELVEGRNRQVRRMTATIGCPTLRLIRVRIGGIRLHNLGINPGHWSVLEPGEVEALLSKKGADL